MNNTGRSLATPFCWIFYYLEGREEGGDRDDESLRVESAVRPDVPRELHAVYGHLLRQIFLPSRHSLQKDKLASIHKRNQRNSGRKWRGRTRNQHGTEQTRHRVSEDVETREERWEISMSSFKFGQKLHVSQSGYEHFPFYCYACRSFVFPLNRAQWTLAAGRLLFEKGGLDEKREIFGIFRTKWQNLATSTRNKNHKQVSERDRTHTTTTIIPHTQTPHIIST